MRVLQLEDDAFTARGNAQALQSMGATVDTAETCEEAFDLIRFGEYDILLVDLQMPDLPGHQFVRRLRARGIHTPIAVVTGHADLPSKIASFEHGADDHIVKPVAPGELIARVRAMVRRNFGFSRNLLCEGDLVVDQDTRQVGLAGSAERLRLSKKEYALLELLMLRRGRVVSNASVMNHLYGDADGPQSRTVAVFLCNLRRKLGEAGLPDVITTLPGVGLMIARREGASDNHAEPIRMAS